MSKVDDALRAWFCKPARWWQFWLPQSGAVGGFLFVVFVTAIVLLTATLAHAQSDADNDGFATVLTAPINEAIDAAFSIIGYEENDDD